MGHAGLTRDISIFYTVQGKPPTFKLYGIFSHRETGTGTPPNLKKQRTISKQLGNAENWQEFKP